MKYIRTMTQQKLSFWLALYIGWFMNVAVFFRRFDGYAQEFTFWKGLSGVVELVATVFVTFFLLRLLSLFGRRIWRILATLIVLFSAAASYYMTFLNVVIGYGIIASVMTTDIDLSKEVIGWHLILWLVAVSAPPLLFIWSNRCRHTLLRQLRTPGQRVKNVLIVVLAAGLVVGLFGMLRRQTEDRKGAESYAEAAAIAGAELPAAESAAQTPAEEQETQDPYLQMFARMDVEALRQVNPEVLGWLWLPNTQISYPLMQGTDNEYYLHNTWKNEPNELGAIFLDYRSAPDFSDFNTLIYGHRMQSDAMFATLRFYAEQAHWESAPLVYVRAGDTVYTFTIFAAYEAPVTQPLYLPALTDAAQIDAVLQYAQEASVLDTGLTPGAEDHILTLVTCTGHGHASRWIVQAVRTAVTPLDA